MRAKQEARPQTEAEKTVEDQLQRGGVGGLNNTHYLKIRAHIEQYGCVPPGLYDAGRLQRGQVWPAKVTTAK